MLANNLTTCCLLLLASFLSAAIAAPTPVPAEQARHVQIRATATTQANATCVSGVPASNATFDIDYAEVSAPTGMGRSYDVMPSFHSAHVVGNAMDLYVTSSIENDYASFKCQYACNGTPGCVSFFGRFVGVNTASEHFECLSYDALLNESSFTQSTSMIANGGFNKLCG